MFKIEKNVPMVTVQSNINRHRARKYPFEFMDVNDSFFVRNGSMGTLSASVGRYNRDMNPKKFSARTVSGGVRVWRVA